MVNWGPAGVLFCKQRPFRASFHAAQGTVSCSHALDKIIFDAQNRCWCIEKKDLLNKNAVQLFNKGFINQMFYPEHGSMMQCLVQPEIMHEKGAY